MGHDNLEASHISDSGDVVIGIRNTCKWTSSARPQPPLT